VSLERLLIPFAASVAFGFQGYGVHSQDSRGDLASRKRSACLRSNIHVLLSCLPKIQGLRCTLEHNSEPVELHAPAHRFLAAAVPTSCISYRLSEFPLCRYKMNAQRYSFGVAVGKIVSAFVSPAQDIREARSLNPSDRRNVALASCLYMQALKCDA
jgi:hypothetical protein